MEHVMTGVEDKLTSDRQELWQAVVQRDAAFDGAFVYAVRSTGVYCRPSCPSRKPKRKHVDFFRVIRKDGGLGGYRWGSVRKAALLRQESATVTRSDNGVDS